MTEHNTALRWHYYGNSGGGGGGVSLRVLLLQENGTFTHPLSLKVDRVKCRRLSVVWRGVELVLRRGYAGRAVSCST